MHKVKAIYVPSIYFILAGSNILIVCCLERSCDLVLPDGLPLTNSSVEKTQSINFSAAASALAQSLAFANLRGSKSCKYD